MINEFNLKTLHFNSLIKTVINWWYHLNDSFEEILNLLDIWINEGFGWVIDKIEGVYIDVADYEPLGSSYIPLPKVLNLKNKDKCFMWCHVRLINLMNSHPERINKHDKKIAANLNYSDISFQLDIKDYEKLKIDFKCK